MIYPGWCNHFLTDEHFVCFQSIVVTNITIIACVILDLWTSKFLEVEWLRTVALFFSSFYKPYFILLKLQASTYLCYVDSSLIYILPKNLPKLLSQIVDHILDIATSVFHQHSESVSCGILFILCLFHFQTRCCFSHSFTYKWFFLKLKTNNNNNFLLLLFLPCLSLNMDFIPWMWSPNSTSSLQIFLHFVSILVWYSMKHGRWVISQTLHTHLFLYLRPEQASNGMAAASKGSIS